VSLPRCLALSFAGIVVAVVIEAKEPANRRWVRLCDNRGRMSIRPNVSRASMSDFYAIETSAGVAGIAIRITAGFRFYAAVDLYGTLEGERWPRIEDLYAAVNRLAAPVDRGAAAVERLSTRRRRSHS
jgi:hypothetical protein